MSTNVTKRHINHANKYNQYETFLKHTSFEQSDHNFLAPRPLFSYVIESGLN